MSPDPHLPTAPPHGIKISVCIPVYNFGDVLGETLDSILPQAGAPVEVLVHDGGSTDGTPGLMERYLRAWPQLRYHRNASRGGLDADLTECTSSARGEYVWIFSGDDVLRPGAMARALERIKSGEDVYLPEHTICDKSMQFLSAYPMFPAKGDIRADLSEPGPRREWFRQALTTEPFFSFLSNLLVRRAKWMSGRLPPAFERSYWGHAARLLELIPTGLKVCRIAEVWLDKRGDNDSFSDRGTVNRYRIAVDGYHELADTYFGHGSEEAFHIRRVIRNEFGFRIFLYAKAKCQRDPDREDRDLLDRLFQKAFCDNPIDVVLTRFLWAVTPLGLYTTARRLKRLLRPKR